MKNTLNIGAKVGFLNSKNKFSWSKVISFDGENVKLKESNKFGYEFKTNISKLLDNYKQGVVKIITNYKNY